MQTKSREESGTEAASEDEEAYGIGRGGRLLRGSQKERKNDTGG